MKPSLRTVVAALVGLSFASNAAAANWPHWRADLAGSGIAQEGPAPTSWSATENVLWKIDLPNRGNSTPVVWGDKVFLTQVIEAENNRTLMCLDRNTGKLLWRQGVIYDKPEKTHKTNPYCSASPTTDGERVIVTFGSAGVFCYDFDGKELWSRDLGPQRHTWGNASSPVIFGDLCILYHGPDPNARLLTMDKKTGKTQWEFKEPKWTIRGRTDGFEGNDEGGIVGSFSTPIIVNHQGRDELIMSFPTQIKAFNPETGEELWSCQGLNPLVYTSPIAGEGVVVAMGGYKGNSVAVKLGGSGDVTQSHRLWQKVRANGGIGSGVVHEGHIYFPDGGGTARCLNLETGNIVWEQRLSGPGRNRSIWSNFTLVGDNVYAINKSGDVIVFKASPEWRQVAANSIGREESNSSIVVVDGEVYLRTYKALWKIGRGKKTASLR
jgi:outer membrane protein assembly factor BamB